MKEQEKSTRKIWHDANEEPDTNLGSIVAVNCAGEIAAFNVGTLAMDYVNEYSIDKWAYIDDLLNINPENVQEVPASDDLEKAAEEIVDKNRDLGNSKAYPQFNCYDAERFIIIGANLQREKMMKNAVVASYFGQGSKGKVLMCFEIDKKQYERSKRVEIIIKEDRK
ncbi:MAG: hypothetical protein IKP36_05275 [Bacteroidaceae bacterium]|nr:hypothetical protein [Bacteroidaceae bacterium]